MILASLRFGALALLAVLILGGCASSPRAVRARPAELRMLDQPEQRISGDYRNSNVEPERLVSLWEKLTGREQRGGNRVRLEVNPRANMLSATLFEDGKMLEAWKGHYLTAGSTLRLWPRRQFVTDDSPVLNGYRKTKISLGRSPERLIVDTYEVGTGFLVVLPFFAADGRSESSFPALSANRQSASPATRARSRR